MPRSPGSLEIEKLPLRDLRRMSEAGDVVQDCVRLLTKTGLNPVSQVLRHQGQFVEMEHYPRGDAFDRESSSQYYYHAHRAGDGEHGHFHTFLRVGGIPQGVKPAVYRGKASRPMGKDAICHLVAISMDAYGAPAALFTTNQWVTGETFYSAPDVIRMLKRFDIDHADPCMATNRWISALLRLFAPQIRDLIYKRDAFLAEYQRLGRSRNVLDDRDVEIISSTTIDVDKQIRAVRRALARKQICSDS